MQIDCGATPLLSFFSHLLQTMLLAEGVAPWLSLFSFKAPCVYLSHVQ